MKTGDLLRKRCQFLTVQRIFQFTTTKDEIDILMRHMVIQDIMGHAPERRNPGSGADKEQVLFYVVRQRKDS